MYQKVRKILQREVECYSEVSSDLQIIYMYLFQVVFNQHDNKTTISLSGYVTEESKFVFSFFYEDIFPPSHFHSRHTARPPFHLS